MIITIFIYIICASFLHTSINQDMKTGGKRNKNTESNENKTKQSNRNIEHSPQKSTPLHGVLRETAAAATATRKKEKRVIHNVR